ncbi:MAG: YraN family protein [Dokdonella sp.]|jgi:putative endonuclease|uniref:YraN family protein n=1 Tax=Dokdonella sp. TaxID=2291710 RepID=UPI001B5BC8A9|nr:YraN family protein [Dokdonella sp.]MBP6327192.1 YraN family protein [Dokdonella sp.]MBP6328817.1 YraN family protein [Dokdonella sp.]HNV08253.1 YraN family protein [Dokdonella sp.]HPW02939.1 YraN family protein [Dokdonella sp.]HQV48794.1 YraN family protein [Dokdonella sp.]
MNNAGWRQVMRSSGSLFEDIALAHAKAQGLSLVERNFNCRFGEIDLILREGNIVVFLEVRYRKSQEFGGAMQSIGSQKRERLLKAASLFLQSRPEFARNACRFDVMAIAGSAQQPDINWQRNAFEAC